MNEQTHISSLVDLTLLDPRASIEQLHSLSVDATQFQVAALCVYPQHLQHLSAPASINRAAVVNFPSGEASIEAVLSEIDLLAQSKAIQEVDYVFPYTSYLAGDEKFALSHSEQVIHRCKEYGLTSKLILETEVFPSRDSIEQLCFTLIEQGCDFLKTSTGTKPLGATIEAVTAILNSIRVSEQPCGLKVSGGIRTKTQAMLYIDLAETICSRTVDASWFRIGTSKLLKDLSVCASSRSFP